MKLTDIIKLKKNLLKYADPKKPNTKKNRT